MSSLSITPTIRAAGAVVLILRGSLGRTDISSFAGAVGHLLRAHRPRRMEVDLSGLLDLEPGTAEAVLAVIRTASREGTEIVLSHAPSTVRQQLRAAGGEPYLT